MDGQSQHALAAQHLLSKNPPRDDHRGNIAQSRLESSDQQSFGSVKADTAACLGKSRPIACQAGEQ